MAAVIGALRVVLGADTAALYTDLDKARDKLSEFGANVGKAGAIAAAAMASAAGAIALGVRNTVNEMDGFAKQAQKIGIPVEQLSALSYAADLSDVSMESLGKGLAKLSKVMVEAAAKPTSEAALAFKALGLSATNSDGSLKSTSEVVADVAGKFEGLKDGAGKTAVSMALFGKSGADLIPMLNSGKSGLQVMAEEARKLGLIISTETVKSAEAFNDNLTRLGKVKNGIIIQLTAHMLPALEALSQRLIDAAKNSNVVSTVSNGLKMIFDGMARAVMLVADNFGLLLKGLALFVAVQITSTAIGLVVAFVGMARAIQAAGLMMAAFEAIRKLSLKGILLLAAGVALASGNFDNLVAGLDKIKGAVENVLPSGAVDGFKSIVEALGFDLSALETDLTKFGTGAKGAAAGQKEFNYAAMGGKNAVDAFLASTAKSQAAQEAELATVGMATGAKEKLRVQMQALAIAQENSIPLTDALKLKIGETALAAEQLALKLQGAQLVQQNLAPNEVFRQEMENNRLAMEAYGATAEQIARVNEATAARAGATWDIAGASIAGSFASISKSFGKENSAMATAAKVFGGIQATISMFTGAAKALELPFPANIAAVAQVLATGASFVASIQSQSVPKMATGGEFKVPGGVGGLDNVPVSFMAQPGERVKIEPNRYGEANSGGDAGDAVRTIRIEGMQPDSVAFGRQIIEAIRLAVGEGGRVVVAPA